MTFARTDVAFPAVDGTTLRGWWYGPGVDRAGGPAAPAVVMAHGFSAVKEMGLEPIARALASAGFAVLVYDHRNLGASDGEPRQEIDIWAQARDYRAALDWVAARPGVRADRIALWGTSFSGGEVLAVAAADRRVAAVVAQVPFAGTTPDVEDADDARWYRMRDLLGSDVSGDASGPAAGPMKVVSECDEPAMLAQPESWRWFRAVGEHEGSRWRNECTVRFHCGAVAFDPGLAVAHVAPTPLLMIVADDDRVAPADVALRAFARAGEPKELLVVEGDHFAAYDGEAGARCRVVTVEFLRRHLR